MDGQEQNLFVVLSALRGDDFGRDFCLALFAPGQCSLHRGWLSKFMASSAAQVWEGSATTFVAQARVQAG